MEANDFSQQPSLSYEDIRKFMLEALKEKETNKAGDLIDILVQKVYRRGWKDGVKRGIQTTYDYLELFDKNKYNSI